MTIAADNPPSGSDVDSPVTTSEVDVDRGKPSARHRFSLREILLVVVGQAAATSFATWPMLRFFSSRAPGDLMDPLHSSWIFAWSAHQIIRSPLRVFDAPMFHPKGLTLALAENMLGLSLPLAPVYWITDNSILYLNLVLFVSMIVAGTGTYVLLRHLGSAAGVAFAAATCFAVMPFRFQQLGHPHVAGLHLIPFVLLLLLMCSEEGLPPRSARRRVAVLAVLVAWQSWASLTAMLLVALLVGAWGVWMLCRGRSLVRGLLRGLIGAAVGFLLTVPVLLPYLKVRADNPQFGHDRSEVLRFSATPGAYLDPGFSGPLVDDIYSPLERFRTETGPWEKHLFPGAFLLLGTLASVPVLVRTRRQGVAVPVLGIAVALVGFVWSLGPRYGAREDGLLLPFELMERVTGGLTRVPARMGMLVPLGMAVIVGVVLGRLSSKGRAVVVVAFAAILVVERYPSVILFPTPPKITAAHRAVADREGAVLALPVFEYDEQGRYLPGTIYEPQHLYLSTAHFRPMLNGYGSYLPPDYLAAMFAVQRLPSEESLAFLARRGVNTVIVQTDMVKQTRWATVVDQLDRQAGVHRVAVGEGVVVFDVHEAAAAAERQRQSRERPPTPGGSTG